MSAARRRRGGGGAAGGAPGKWGIAARSPARGPAPARTVAARVLERVERDAAFADLALEAELARAPLTQRDAALATELVYGTLRWQRYLDWIVAPHSRRRLTTLDPRVRVLLRMTAYQLAFLARVPAFAAVSDAVSLARELLAKHGGLRGLLAQNGTALQKETGLGPAGCEGPPVLRKPVLGA